MRREGRKGRRAATGGSATISAGADPSQLLPMALHHHERGDLARARALYEQVIKAAPEHADALQFFGILCHQQGDSAAAESLIRRAITIKPDVAPYHDNLGTVLERAGRLDEALVAYAAADALEPGDPDRNFNMGLALERAGRVDEAETRLREALEARPEDAECRFALANVLKLRGADDQARTAYRLVLNGDPGHAGALVNLGNLLLETGELAEAERLYREALVRHPNDAPAHHNLARLERRAGRLDEARAGFERALRHAPGLADARLGLAQCLEELGELDAALRTFREIYRGDPVAGEARAGLVRVARVVAPRVHDPLLEEALLAAVEEGAVPASALSRALGRQLLARAGIEAGTVDDGAAVLKQARALCGEPLFRAVLEQTVNVEPLLERWLTRMRRQLLLEAPSRPGDRGLLGTLAIQCAANDHVFSITPEEVEALASLTGRLEAWLAGADVPAAPGGEELACHACYRPLAALAGAAGIPARLGADDAWLAPVLERSLLQPLDERERAGALTALGSVDDAASRQVREQYEEHPYPRWSGLPPASSIGGLPRARLERAAAAGEVLDILVAGCGTGQEPLALAARFPGHRLVALDLSRASLAYAARMADSMGIEGVEFVHGDLLQAARLGRRFDLITATGVLHHMADPVAGWRALRECLAPGGLMKIGLYSATARSAVNVARARIRTLGLGADADAVRTFRERILGGAEPELHSLLESEDFYTTSTCRDLLFHPVEHQFDLPGVARILEDLELEFRGFELPHPLLQRAFDRSGAGMPSDLGAWARFEAANPDAFEAMYVFWCAPGAGEEARDA